MAGERILVVEDSQINSTLVSFILTERGYDVRCAGSASEALALLDTFAPRLVLMDLNLPGMDGLTLTRHLKSSPATRDLVIVAWTAHMMSGSEARALESGIDGYITKPIDTRAFPNEVARYLERARSKG
jgi:CheY-like chemotaxis protein